VIKRQKDSLSISDPATWWRRATELASARILHIRPSHITTLALPMLHKDPFDRILVAQAKAEGLGLVTNDGPIGDLVQTIRVERVLHVRVSSGLRLAASLSTRTSR
jgi:PIN domain nuclease of toxin-antitoxin system